MVGEVTVLHVDDEPSMRDLTKTFLEREDEQFTVETAASAEEGLDMLGDRPPDCIVSDYNMPGMDGLEFLETVREECPELPFILLTGRGSEEVASDAISAGVTDYLQKRTGTEQYELLANRVRNAVQARRDAERAARQEQLMRLTEFAGDTGGFELDIEADDVVLTDGARRILNVPEQASHSHEGGLEYYHPDDRERIQQTIQRALRTGEQTQGTWRYQHPEGEEQLLNITYTPTTVSGGTTVVRGAIHDITEQQQQQRELETERRVVRQALDALDDIFYMIDADGTLCRWNETGLDMTGYSETELEGMSALELFPEDERERVSEAVETTLTDGEATLQADLLTADGERLPYEFKGARLTDENGEPAGLVGVGRGLTDHREQEQRFRALPEGSEDIISVVDADGQYQYLSPSFERALGHDPEERLGNEWWDDIHPDDREGVRGAFERSVNDHDRTEPLECRFRHADGSWRRVEARDSSRSGDHAVDGLVVTSRDSTARAEREQEGEHAQELLTNVERLADIGAWEYDSARERLTVTEGIRRLYGLDPGADLTLEAALDAVHPEDRGPLAARFNACVETGEPYETEVRLATANGGQRWVAARGERVEGRGSGGVMRGYIQDITEEQRQRRQLENTAARLEALFDRSPDMVDIHDTDGNILDVNQQFAETTGYAKSELTEMKVWDIDTGITPDEARTLWRDMDPDDRRQTTGAYECRDDSTVPVEVNVRRLDTEEEDLFVVISRDITEQTERERELERQNERLAEFARVVSHDLRSPLTVAEGRLELAQETCESDALATAADAVDRSQTLIDDLLRLAREGEQVTEVEAITLADVAAAGWQTTETQSATLDTDTTRAIRADRSRLQELFENLYRNSVEHSNGEVTVSVGAMDNGFYVADTGPGIPDSEREAVFEAGYSTNEDGTGFGLRIVEQIADAHGWGIAVTESDRGGARFEVTGVEFVDR
jgi:PAS domain S-box-containing protein